ncbi:MAG TPA: PD-(D/E)XK nuclease family protein [bacterium]|nr:PD-(D/E)XK nuclease family protein [bacterium]
MRYYRHWGGWEPDADPLTKAAYRLGKMTTMPIMVGQAVHEVLARHFRALRNGQPRSLDPEEPVRMLRRVWKDNLDEKWRLNPKKFPPLFELYYRRVPPREKLLGYAEQARGAVRACREMPLLGRLASLAREDFLWVDTAGGAFSEATRFPVGSFEAIANPDLVVRLEGAVTAFDWKTGKSRSEDRLQLEVVGLWIDARIGSAAGARGSLVYLGSGEVDTFDLDDRTRELARETVVRDMERMGAYLRDPGENLPLDMEQFPMQNNKKMCDYCQFQEICHPIREVADEYG